MVDLGASTHSHTVVSGDTLIDIAAALAENINTNAAADFTASAMGDILVITNAAGAFTTTFTISPAGSVTDGSFLIDADATADTVTLSGDPVPGEDWEITLDDSIDSPSTHSYTVLNGDTLADIVIALAEDINANAAAGFTAAAEGDVLVIVNLPDDTFTTTFDITTTAGHDIDQTDNATTTTTTLLGTPEEGEIWAVLLTVDSVTNALKHTVEAGDTLADIAAALADRITGSALADFSANAEGDALTVINRAGTAFTASIEIQPNAMLDINSTVAITTTVELAGTPVTGEVWQVVLDDSVNSISTHTHPVTGGDTLNDIATALAADINAGAAGDFTAVAEGDLLLIVNRDGQAFTTTFTITPAAGSLDGSFTIDETTALTTVAELVGGPFAGEVWKAYVTVDDVTTVHSYPVTGSDTLDDVAAQLAIDINTNAPAEFTVTTEGKILVIINRVGTSFSTGYKITSATAISDEISSAAADSAVITLSGTPVAGETWEIDLASGSYDYVVAADDRLSDIVAALVDDINTNAPSAFTAAVKGISFVVVNDSATFTPTFTITPFNGYAIASPDSAATVTLSGTPEADEIWTVNLGTSTHSHRVTISQSLADIAAALAEDINANAAGDFTATTEGDVLIIANRAGSSFTTTFAITVRSAYAIDNSTAATTTAVFTATPVEGEVWTVDLGTSTHSHTVDSGETVEDIVLSLADDINTNAANDFAAVSNGDTLVIVNIAGSTFTTTTTITPSGSLAVDDATAASTMAMFTGTPVANEIWYLTVATGTETHSFNHAIAGGDTLADVATAIAASINADPAAPDYTAMALGDTVIIVNIAGDAFTTTFDITLEDGYTGGSVVVDAATAIAATAELSGLPPEGEVYSM